MGKEVFFDDVPVESVGQLRGKKITVMGLGTKGGGVETARYLARHGALVTATDLGSTEALSRSVASLEGTGVKFVLGRHDEKDFAGADIVMRNPAVPDSSPLLQVARKNGVPITTDIALFLKFCPSPVAGVTGTRGKSTFVTVAGEIMKRTDPHTVVAGNILRSPLMYLDEISEETPVILELSSWQLEGLAPLGRSPRYAALTTIYPDHLNRYQDMDAYVDAKSIIYRFHGGSDELIFNADDARVAAMAKEAPAGTKLSYSAKGNNGAFLFRDGDKLVIGGAKGRELMPYGEIAARGEHTKSNVVGGALLALRMGAREADARAVLKGFAGLADRLESIGSARGIEFVNDTAATIPEAVLAACAALSDKKIVLIAGGTDKNLDFAGFAANFPANVRALVPLSGSATEKMLAALSRAGIKTERAFSGMEEAVAAAAAIAETGDAVLMSPGAASFGMFRDEFERGDKFRRAAKRIIEEEA